MDDDALLLNNRNLLGNMLTSKEREFLSLLKGILLQYFELDFSDLQDVLRLMGIDDPIYALYVKDNKAYAISMYVYTRNKFFVGKKKYELIIHKGSNENSSSEWELVDGDYTECFNVGPGIQVQKVSRYDKEGNMQFC